MGLGQIYFNLRGREVEGDRQPGRRGDARSPTRCAARLLTLTDPDDGSPIVRAVYKRDDVYSGEFLQNASELQVGMEDGYRVSWQTALGGSPQGIVYPNMKKWSGDHGGYDYATTSGVLMSSRRSRRQAAVDPGHRADGAEVLRPARSRRISMASRCSDSQFEPRRVSDARRARRVRPALLGLSRGSRPARLRRSPQ